MLESMRAGHPSRTPPATGQLPNGKVHPAGDGQGEEGPPAEAAPKGVPFQAGLPRPIGKGGIPAALAALLNPPAEGETPAEPVPADPGPVPDPQPVLPVQPPVTETLPVEPDPMLQAQVIALQAPSLASAPEGETEGTPDTRTATATAAPEAAEAEDARLEAFVRKAAAHATATEGPDGQAEAAPVKDPLPTFGDLVKLAVQTAREQGGRPEAHPQESPADAPRSHTPPAHAAAAQKPHILPVAPEPGQSVEPAAPAEPKESGPQGLAVGFGKTPAAERLGLEAEAPAPERPQMHEEQIVRQTVKFVKLMADSKQTEVHLRLHPEHLGQVAVKLILENGAVRANLVAQDAAVKTVLETNLDQLRTRLQEQGIPITQVDVAVGSGSEFSQPRHGQQSGHGQQAGQGRPHQMQQLREEQPELLQQPQQEAPSWARKWTGSRLNALA